MRGSAEDNLSESELALLMGDEEAAVLAFIRLLDAMTHARLGEPAEFQRFELDADLALTAVFVRSNGPDVIRIEGDLDHVVPLIVDYLKAHEE